LLSGVASWRGWNVRFTDGICEQCLARFRAEHQRFLQKRAEPVSSSARPTQAA
jgi:Fe-S cluster biosynthesis and repair protein YggX